MEAALITISIVLLLSAVAASVYLAKTRSALAVAQKELAVAAAERAAATSALDSLNAQLDSARGEIKSAQSLEMQLREELSAMAQRLKSSSEELNSRKEAEEAHFKVLASEILAANSRTLREQSEQRLDQILAPLKENLDQFRKAVTDAYSNEARERFSLTEKIKELVELNNTIGREAKELSQALRGNSKIQGDWGEMILESILEKSGLRRGEEYEVQATTDASGQPLKSEDGRQLRPDVVIRYPDGRSIVVDSKVSLTAYVDLVNADDPAEHPQHERKLLTSIRNHMKELDTKRYQDVAGGELKADFVMMFIPNEGAYIAAMQLDHNLWQEAYDRRILIVSPTHLISVVRLVEQLWRNDRMTRNVISIAEEGGRMYDKLVAFVDDMAKIKKSLKAADEAYTQALNKLSQGKGNLIKRAENMRRLGAKASKQLPSALFDEDEAVASDPS